MKKDRARASGGLNRFNAVMGNYDQATAIAVTEMAGTLDRIEAAQVAHYAYQDEMARQQTALLAEIRDAVTR